MASSSYLDALIKSGKLYLYPGKQVSAINTTPAIRIGFNKPGSYGSIVVSGTVATAFTFYVDGVADTTIGPLGTGIVSLATSTTIGALVDVCNLSPYWRAQPGATLRADLTYTSTSPTFTAGTYYIPHGMAIDIPLDTNIALTTTPFKTIVGMRFSQKDVFRGSDVGSENVLISVAGLVASPSTSGTLLLRAYSVNDAAKTEPMIYQSALTTATWFGLTEANFSYLTALPGDALLIQVENRYTSAEEITITSPVVANAARKLVIPGGVGAWRPADQ